VNHTSHRCGHWCHINCRNKTTKAVWFPQVNGARVRMVRFPCNLSQSNNVHYVLRQVDIASFLTNNHKQSQPLEPVDNSTELIDYVQRVWVLAGMELPRVTQLRIENIRQFIIQNGDFYGEPWVHDVYCQNHREGSAVSDSYLLPLSCCVRPAPLSAGWRCGCLGIACLPTWLYFPSVQLRSSTELVICPQQKPTILLAHGCAAVRNRFQLW